VQRQEFPKPICLALALALASCTSTRHAIVAATGTNIGVDVSQSPATNSPQAKLGYQRVELAIVPTNRSAGEEPGDKGSGASEYGDVIMELRYGGIFDTGPSSGIYQRLAVGSEAVRQLGASLMFARDADGNVSKDAEAALRSLMSIPAMRPAARPGTCASDPCTALHYPQNESRCSNHRRATTAGACWRWQVSPSSRNCWEDRTWPGPVLRMMENVS
jgi:hypothetical protein